MTPKTPTPGLPALNMTLHLTDGQRVIWCVFDAECHPIDGWKAELEKHGPKFADRTTIYETYPDEKACRLHLALWIRKLADEIEARPLRIAT